MEKIFGLPAHPLLVHGPVVLVPLVALAAALLALRPRWRHRYGPALAIAAGVVVIMTLLAASSGEALQEALQRTGATVAVRRHADLADMTKLIVIGMFFSVLGLVVSDRLSGRSVGAAASNRSIVLPTVFAALTVLTAIAGTIWMIRTGHAGAEIVWSETLS